MYITISYKNLSYYKKECKQNAGSWCLNYKKSLLRDFNIKILPQKSENKNM